MRVSWVAAAIGLALAAAPVMRARADVLIDTMGASAGFDVLAPTAQGGGGPIALSFSTGSQGLALSSVTAVLAAGSPTDGGTIVVSLWNNNPTGSAGGLPAPRTNLDTLATINDSSLTSSFANINIPVTSAIALAANSRYWIELAGSSSSSAEWSYIDQASAAALPSANEYNWNNYSGAVNSSALNGSYGTDMIAVSAVPEPGSWLLVGAACLLLAFLRPRRAIQG